MSDLVSPDQIEQIVGINRHATRHYARAVSGDQAVYILHSQLCKDCVPDLRECPFSLALDNGIDEWLWGAHMDKAIRVSIDRDCRLIPVAAGMRFAR